MELMKEGMSEFKFRDITFWCRTSASLADQLAKDALMAEALSSKSIDKMPKIGLGLIKIFIFDWDGVTRDGAKVPYSFDLMLSSFPAEMANELLPGLIKFVKESVDILK